MFITEWLLFSPTSGRAYCLAWKLSCQSVPPCIELVFPVWKRAEEKTSGRESSAQKKQSMVQWLIRANKEQSVYRHMAEQYKNQVKYWQNVLQGVMAVVTFLAKRGLALRGDD
jgi:hypothetical protein